MNQIRYLMVTNAYFVNTRNFVAWFQLDRVSIPNRRRTTGGVNTADGRALFQRT